jgi:RNA polymerase sigma-70 factor (ECF subfamily)
MGTGGVEVEMDGGGPADGFAAAWRANRAYLVDLAFRMLADVGDAQDVVQEAFVRLARTAPGEVDDPRGWLTVVTSRLCLDQIRSARARREQVAGAVEDAAVPLAGPAGAQDPADRVTLDDEVRAALLVLLERLGPAERVAFVLHDVFRTPFEVVAQILGRPEATCRQLARRARRKVAELPPRPHAVAPAEHRLVAERFARACTTGDLDALLAVLHPRVWGRADLGPGFPGGVQVNRGAAAVAANLVRYYGSGATMVGHPLGTGPALLAYFGRELFAVVELTVEDELVVAVQVTAVGPLPVR